MTGPGTETSLLGNEPSPRSILLLCPLGCCRGGGRGAGLGSTRGGGQLPWVLQGSGRQRLLCSVVASPPPQFIYRFSKLFS